MLQKCSFVFALLLANISFASQMQAQVTSKNPAPATKKSSPKPNPQTSSGERIFAQNCSRCHAAPQGFPSRISGTVVMHMRVRASLSQEDAQAVLRFLNP